MSACADRIRGWIAIDQNDQRKNVLRGVDDKITISKQKPNQ
jgi:hypothetical protein